MLTQKRVKEIIKYDPETGILTWRKPSRRTTVTGKEAGSLNQNGYREVEIGGKTYKAHRLAWLYVHGYLPESYLDHLDRVRDNNRISNLREVNQSCNMKNSSLYSTNKSGVAGVYWNKDAEKWHARVIDKNGKRVHLGHFIDLQDAVKARYDGEVKFGYPECAIESTAKQFLDMRC